MSTAKNEVRALLDKLPDDCTLEDVQYHLYVMEKIHRGQEDIRNGRHYTSDQARERLSQWLKP